MWPKIPNNKSRLLIFVGILFIIVVFFWWQFFSQDLSLSSSKGEGWTTFTNLFSKNSDYLQKVKQDINLTLEQRATEIYNQEQVKKNLARLVAENLKKTNRVNYVSPWISFIHPAWWEIRPDVTGEKLIGVDISASTTQPVVFSMDFVTAPKISLELWTKQQFVKDTDMQNLTQVHLDQVVASSSTAYLVSQAGSQKVKQVVVIGLGAKVAVIKAEFVPEAWAREGESFMDLVKSIKLP